MKKNYILGTIFSVNSNTGNLKLIFKKLICFFLEGFIDGIRTDGTTRDRMPKDGTVFQLTANVMR